MFEVFANVLGEKGKLLLEVVGVGKNPGAAAAAAKKAALRRIEELNLFGKVEDLELVAA